MDLILQRLRAQDSIFHCRVGVAVDVVAVAEEAVAGEAVAGEAVAELERCTAPQRQTVHSFFALLVQL